MSGKPFSEPPIRAVATPPTNKAASQQTTTFEINDFPDLSRQLAEYYCTTLRSSRPGVVLLVAIELDGRAVPAIVDSGATSTYLGDAGIKFAERLGYRSRRVASTATTIANGEKIECNKEFTLTLTLKHVTRKLAIRHFARLPVPLLLGLDALSALGMVVDHRRRVWSFSGCPETQYEFERLDSIPFANTLLKISDLEPSETQRLSTFLDREIPKLRAAPGVTDLIIHRMDVGNAAPIKQRYYPVTPIIREAMNAEVDRMLEAGVIEPSNSDWSTPIVMVKKPNHTYRFCLDFRKVNSVTKKDAYPLPYMSQILDRLRAAKYISTLDLSQAYHQIRLAPESREITAFTVPHRGLFQFTRMPFGLSNAPATFQRLLDRLIGPELEPHAFAYLDDIIIVNETFEEHLEWLKRVFDIVTGAGLLINPDKCDFCCTEVRYLGFRVNRNGLQVDPEKTAPIREFPVPTGIKPLRRLLGMASWYRRFVPHFAAIAAPLTKLTKKSQRWLWGEEQQLAFEKLREALVSPPTLACPDFNAKFTLQTDASMSGLGAVLTQELEGIEHPIAYASRSLSAAERNYSTTEQECLAILWAIRKFRAYLEGYQFTVITDHHSLRWLQNLKDPAGRLARWALQLAQYDFEVVHRKGALNHVPDALSRMFEDDPPNRTDAVSELEDENWLALVTGIAGGVRVEREPVDESSERWYARKLRDVQAAPARFPRWKIIENRLYVHRRTHRRVPAKGDYSEWKLVVPRAARDEVLRENHDEPQAGHLGVDKTYQRIFVSYYWPGMMRDVIRHVRHCETCQRVKSEQLPPIGMMGRRIVDEPWSVVAADIMGPLPRSHSGFCYVLVIQDLFTKWVECCALRKANGKRIGEALEDLVFSRWGTPQVLLTDNGTEFANNHLDVIARTRGIHRSFAPPYHPQANPVERVNRVLKTMMVSFIENDHKAWDEHLPEFRFAYNTAHHSTINNTPAFLNLGREPKPHNFYRRREEGELEIEPLPPEEWSTRMQELESVRVRVTHDLEEAYQRQSAQYNKHRRDETFAKGELVLKRQRVLSSAANSIAAKLTTRYHGPFRIRELLSPGVVQVEDPATKKTHVVSIVDLKKYFSSPVIADLDVEVPASTEGRHPRHSSRTPLHRPAATAQPHEGATTLADAASESRRGYRDPEARASAARRHSRDPPRTPIHRPAPADQPDSGAITLAGAAGGGRRCQRGRRGPGGGAADDDGDNEDPRHSVPGGRSGLVHRGNRSSGAISG